jgi:three-Cys-motif partner protein
MLSKAQQEDLIGKWSVEKLELLRKYLSAYVGVLTKQSWCKGYEYIDAFAGTGKPKTKDEEEYEIYVDGSPRIALSLEQPFTQYHFIEQSGWRAEKLKQLEKEYAGRRSITVYHGDCNKILREQILPQLAYATKKRAIAFIDPFGMEFEWQTMEDIAKTKTIEVFLNFPNMAINREVLRKHPDKITEKAKTRLNQFWGTEDWLDSFYQEESTLFGPEVVKKRLSGKDFGKVFKQRLKEIFTHCTDPILMANSNNAPLYCLLFAGHNETGVKIASDIFAKHEREKQ